VTLQTKMYYILLSLLYIRFWFLNDVEKKLRSLSVQRENYVFLFFSYPSLDYLHNTEASLLGLRRLSVNVVVGLYTCLLYRERKNE